jgi:2-keto-4-pentenoate hydratase/2-oxohepta-3-ene-1,7-dioic acid hydratase in catechol pathway
MKIRRVNGESGQSLEVLGEAGWGPLGNHGGLDADLVNTLKACPPPSSLVGTPLPFQPRSYRDFMLFERHYIQAARGYLRRFRPSIGRLASVYELVMRRTFPPLKPAALWYRQPIYYMGNHLRFVPDGAEIPWPNYTNALDYELELGFFLSKPLLDASPQEAESAIGGFVVFNDISARDVQVEEMGSGFGPQKAKHFCNVISSVVVSADEILSRLSTLKGRVRINGKIVAECSAEKLQFSLGEAIAHVSRAEQLYPGEFFGTGTWPDGSGMENGNWPKPGDDVELEIDGVGKLANRIGALPQIRTLDTLI